MSDIACKYCRFFRGDASVMGSCRRFPQTVNMYPADWCGEFQSIRVTPIEPEPVRNKPGRKPKYDPSVA